MSKYKMRLVYLMLENRSFDYIFGYRGSERSDINGVKHDTFGYYYNTPNGRVYYNLDSCGNKYFIEPTSSVWEGEYRMDNSYDTYIQAYNWGRMDGFVRCQEKFPGVDLRDVMQFARRGSFPLMDYLADNYLIYDNYFSSVPNQTYANRSFSISGTSCGLLLNEEMGNDNLLHCRTILDELDKKGVSWRVYYSDITFLLLNKNGRLPHMAKRYSHISNLQRDLIEEGNSFPMFVMIEPDYSRVSYEGKQTPDSGQELLYTVYTSLRSSIDWENTALFVNYDESNGFYDHVTPPKCVEEGGNKFGIYGPRVPAMLISPRLKPHCYNGVDSRLYDHTSVLKYLCSLYKLCPLTMRVQFANNIFEDSFCDIVRNIPQFKDASFLVNQPVNRYLPSVLLNQDTEEDNKYQKQRIMTNVYLDSIQ